MNGSKLPSRFYVDNKRYVMCMPHANCPMVQGKAPTVETCWDHISLPGRFCLDRAFNSTDPRAREKARRAAVKDYLDYMFQPTQET